MMLAILPEPGSFSAIGWTLGSLAALAVVINQVMKLIDRIKDKPAPAQVREETAERYVRRDDCAEKHRLLLEQLDHGDRSRKGIYIELEKMRKEMGEMERRIGADNEERLTRVYDQINAVLKAVSRVEGALEERRKEKGKE